LLVLRCPSGCGIELPINLDTRAGPAWRLYNPGRNASLYPSVWRESGCKAHFILSRGQLWVAGDDRGLWEGDPDDKLLEAIRERVSIESEHYFQVADAIAAEPWEVLRAFRWLVRRAEVEEDVEGSHGHFRKARSRRRTE
jgi:hypothetical protein